MHVMCAKDACNRLLAPDETYQLSESLCIHSITDLLAIMPRKYNDHDLVTYSELKSVKEPAPPIQVISHFEPFIYTSKQNTPCISSTTDSSNPEVLFSLFFTTSTIQIFVNATNENAILKRSKYTKQQLATARLWRSVYYDKIQIYLGIAIFMRCQRLRTVNKY